MGKTQPISEFVLLQTKDGLYKKHTSLEGKNKILWITQVLKLYTKYTFEVTF